MNPQIKDIPDSSNVLYNLHEAAKNNNWKEKNVTHKGSIQVLKKYIEKLLRWIQRLDVSCYKDLHPFAIKNSGHNSSVGKHGFTVPGKSLCSLQNVYLIWKLESDLK